MDCGLSSCAEETDSQSESVFGVEGSLVFLRNDGCVKAFCRCLGARARTAERASLGARRLGILRYAQDNIPPSTPGSTFIIHPTSYGVTVKLKGTVLV